MRRQLVKGLVAVGRVVLDLQAQFLGRTIQNRQQVNVAVGDVVQNHTVRF